MEQWKMTVFPTIQRTPKHKLSVPGLPSPSPPWLPSLVAHYQNWVKFWEWGTREGNQGNKKDI